MNKDQFQGNFRELKGKIKEKWGKLTDDEITQINGNFEQLLGKLQQKYGYTKEKVEEELRNWNLPLAGAGAGSGRQQTQQQPGQNPGRERTKR